MIGYTGIAESVIEKGETFREKAYVFFRMGRQPFQISAAVIFHNRGNYCK